MNHRTRTADETGNFSRELIARSLYVLAAVLGVVVVMMAVTDYHHYEAAHHTTTFNNSHSQGTAA